MTIFLLTFNIILFLDMKLSSPFQCYLQRFLEPGVYKDHVVFPQLLQEKQVIRTIKRLHSKLCLALQPAGKEGGCIAETTEQGQLMKNISLS